MPPSKSLNPLTFLIKLAVDFLSGMVYIIHILTKREIIL